jgi:TonB-linked SusC/RagA family outer membrane protein
MMKRLLLNSFVLLCLLFSYTVAYAQGKTISGKVTSKEDGTPLPGVTVMVKGTTVGTQTDVEGMYKLSVDNDAKILVFSFVGMKTEEREIGSQTTIDFVMSAETSELSEVVVTALGFKERKDRLATTSSTVGGSALAQSGETGIAQALSAKSPGVIVTRSTGDPGAGANIQIRGASTITSNTQPLLIIDGVPISNNTVDDTGIILGSNNGTQTSGVVQQSRMNDINPEDIESMEVLRGAAAASLWGTRAANGVIIITTKKGKRGDKINASFRSSWSIDQINQVPALQTAFGQGTGGIYDPFQLRSWGDRIANRKGGADDVIKDPNNPDYYGYMVMSDGTERYMPAAGTAANPSGGKNSKNVYEHAKEVFGNGFMRDNTLNLSGGNQSGTFFLSIGNVYQKGIALRNSDYDRTTVRLNVERQLMKGLKVAVNGGYTRTLSNRVQQGSNTSGIFLGGLRTPPDYNNGGAYIGDYYSAPGVLEVSNAQATYRAPIGYSNITGFGAGFDNPFYTIDKVTNQSKVGRFIGGLEVTYEPFEWLSIINRTGLDTYTDDRSFYAPSNSAAYAGTGTITKETIAETQTNNDLMGRVMKDFTPSLSFTGLVGFNLNERRATQLGNTSAVILNPDAPLLVANSPNTARTPFNLSSIIRTGALYAQVDLAYKDMLFFTATTRAESSSTFGRNVSNTFYYPSVSLAWQFTKLDFLKDSKVLSFGKVRASFGQVGVQPPPYATLTYQSIIGQLDGWGAGIDGAAFNGGAYRSTTKGNPNLKPERKTEIELGTDLRFWSDRFGLSVTYYNNTTTDAILQINTSPTTGFNSQWLNGATIKNQGLEINADLAIIKTKDFSWNMSPNWSMNRNEVTELLGAEKVDLGGFTGSLSVATVGQPMGAFWGGRLLREGGKLKLNANGFPTLDPTQGVIGNAQPTWRAGIGNTFKYKGVSLFMLWDMVYETDVWNGTKGALYSYGTHSDVSNTLTISAADAKTLKIRTGRTIEQAYKPNADGTYSVRGNIENFGAGNVVLDETWYRTGIGNGFNGPAELFVERVSWARLREVTLSYSLRTAGFKKATKLESIDFSFTGRNLLLLTNYTGVDPETNLVGVSNARNLDYFNNPGTKSFIFTVKINY